MNENQADRVKLGTVTGIAMQSDSDFQEPDNEIDCDIDNELDATPDVQPNIETPEQTYTASIPNKFSFHITQENWQQITIEDTRRNRKLSRNWLSVFMNYFKQKVPSCPLKVTRNFVQKEHSRKSRLVFFTGKAACKFKQCISFIFKIRKHPRGRKHVKVRVTTVGGTKVNHDLDAIHKRHFQGKERLQAKERIKDVGSTNFFYERFANADTEALKAGNLSGIGTKSTIQKLSSEVNLENRIHRDLVTEVTVIRRVCLDLDTTSRIIKGYVQLFAVQPFCVHMYTEQQLDHLHSLIHSNEGHLYFDATGTVIHKIEGDEKPVFYYPLLGKGVEGLPAFPVAEMITNSHAAPDITNFLLRVFRSCCQLHPGIRPPQRVEVDFSFALINGIILAFNQESSHAYIARAAKIVRGHGDTSLFKRKTVVHICSAHVMHFMSKRFSRCTADKGLRQFLMYAIALFIDCTLLGDILELFQEICIILLAPRNTSHVNFAYTLEKLKRQMKTRCIEPDEEQITGSVERESENQDFEQATSYKDSFFGKECLKIKDSVKNALMQKEGVANSYASGDCLNAIQTLMGTAPLWTGLMLGDLRRHQDHVVQEDVKHDTNAIAENWMGLVKRHILQGKTRLQPGQFISKMYVAITGRIRELQMKKDRQRVRSTPVRDEESGLLEEETWNKKGKRETKVKKGKYFQAVDDVPSPKSPMVLKPKKKKQKKSNEKKVGLHVLHWGGDVNVGEKRICVSNTCPVDNMLYILFRLCEERVDIAKWIKDHSQHIPVCNILLLVFDSFRRDDWAQGRKIWLEKCCGFSQNDGAWDVYGSESERFVVPYSEIQETVSRSQCSSRRCPTPNRLNISREILLSQEGDDDGDLQLAFCQWENAHTVPCRARFDGNKTCKGKRHWDNREFTLDQPPILIPSVSFLSAHRGFNGDRVPERVKVLGMWYGVFGFTMTTNRGTHFIGHFKVGVDWWKYDGLSRPELTLSSTSEVQGLTNLEHLILCLD